MHGIFAAILWLQSGIIHEMHKVFSNESCILFTLDEKKQHAKLSS